MSRKEEAEKTKLWRAAGRPSGEQPPESMDVDGVEEITGKRQKRSEVWGRHYEKDHPNLSKKDQRAVSSKYAGTFDAEPREITKKRKAEEELSLIHI